MKRSLIVLAVNGILAIAAHAGIFGTVKHLALDGYHVVKYQAIGVAHAVKHASHDAKTVAK